MIAHDVGLDFMRHDDWSIYLDIIMHAYNTTPNQMTSYAPMEIVFGRNARLPAVQVTDEDDSVLPQRTAAEFIDYVNTRRAIIIGNAQNVQDRYDELRKRKYDEKRSQITPLSVGDFVFYDISQKYVGNRKKFAQNYVGPFEIEHIFNDGNNLKLVDCTDATHRVTTHLSHVKRYVPQQALMCNAPAVLLCNYQIVKQTAQSNSLYARNRTVTSKGVSHIRTHYTKTFLY